MRNAWLVLALLLLSSCSLPRCGGDSGSEAVLDSVVEQRFERPPANSPGTLRGLGPHLWESSLDKRGDAGGIHASKVATQRLVWAEIDYYECQDFGEDGVRFEERRVGPTLFRRNSADALFVQRPGTPGDSLILQRSLMAWDEVVSPFGDQLAYRREQDSAVDGRAVRVYSLSVAPPVAPSSDTKLSLDAAANLAGLAVTPLQLSGRVYVDIETGNRLLAEIEGRYVPRRMMGNIDPEDEVHFTYRESRSPSQLAPTIAAPPPHQVRVVQQRPQLGYPVPRRARRGQ